MKYYSENLKKLFDTEEALNEAESAEKKRLEEKAKKEKELTATRKARANEIEDLLKERAKIEKAIKDKLSDFTKDYGAFHWSCREPDLFFNSFFDLFF